ncbi:hypothetical protein [Mycobacterium sp.]|uniref:hypothetical protein n=1 Tax=Mycobacterium sp. TaxID=1785 RepID=UPI00127A6CBF|nr:hypothetical protein [Mycobacterium sp.]KAA8969229.1 MAG: hypothetical protein F6Q13_03800 [Mycobacterium sp.]
MEPGLWGVLTIIAFCLVLLCAAIASFYIQRLLNRAPLPISEELDSAFVIIKKLRKRQPLSGDELAYAQQIIADRSAPMALCAPGTLFMLGFFYVCGSLYHLHGATPSERTFLGVIPMLASVNLAFRLISSAGLKKRLRDLLRAY